MIATTERVRRDLEEVHGVPAELVDVIPYQVELDRLAEAARGTIRRDLGLPAGTPLLLFVGHNFEAKGLFEAIEALAGLEHEAHLVVVGNGTRTPFEEAAARAGLGHRVHFVGRTEAPERYYAEADVLVHPTRGEPWGIPPVEAMAAGVPVVTTEGAGSAEVVRSSRAGLVLADNSPPLLRAAISALLRDPARRREMGERGRAAAARFSPHAHAEAVLATYRQAIDGRPGL